jgi:hypothetical protein
MLGDGRCMCGGRAPTDGPAGIEGVLAPVAEGAAEGVAETAASPTDLPQSMQNRDPGEFERPQNAQTIKRDPPGSTPVRRVNIRPGQYEEQ